MKISKTPPPCPRRGTVLAAVLILTAVLVSFAAAGLVFTRSAVSETERERRELQALYAAEAGVNAGLMRLAEAYRTGAEVDANVGSDDAPEPLEIGEYWSTVTENADGSFTILATGTSGRADRSIEAIVRPIPPSPLEHAMFAGNFSGDTSYELGLGGGGQQADYVTGDIYSGGDINIEGDAVVGGVLRAGGSVYGAPGHGGIRADYPQILETDYEAFNDHDVQALFTASTRLSDNAGGYADQLPIDNPVHFLRRNPSDRVSDTNSTEKDDYFIEDPYESVRVDRNQDGTDAFEVSLPETANNSVIFVDGNLWLHNRKSYSFRITNEGTGPTRVTFVVKGNIYFSDNLFYGDQDQDGVAFIALADPDVEDSGNVYFGDPVFGTMQYAEAMFFAEDNFFDNNLDAAGSSTVELRGCMTAGNQVSITRDFVRSDGRTAHTKLGLTFDDRQAAGQLDLPGIPTKVDHPVGYSIATWREVPVPKVHVVAVDPIEVDSPVPPPTEVPDEPVEEVPVEDGVPTEADETVGDDEVVEEPVDVDPVEEPDWRRRWNRRFDNDWRTKKRRWGRWWR